MTAETTGAKPLVASDVLTGGARRLNPMDGLLLRAEHLATMQDYALALATGVGRGGGAGVDFGYQLGVSTEQATGEGSARTVLSVGPGLAHTAEGRPLSSTMSLDLPLTTLTGDTYVVWAVAADQATDEVDQVIGNLCGDPCSGEGGFRPYRAEGVRVEVRGISLTTRPGTEAHQRRSSLAEAYFERERGRFDPLLRADAVLVPPDPWRRGNVIGARETWSGGTALPDTDAGVALGLLLRLSVGWVVDTWAARRDRMEMPAHRWWFSRLSLRPLPLFLAEVLQFQAQLADAESGWGDGLAEAGFASLPPAGFLPVGEDPPLDERLEDLFGGRVDYRVIAAPLDEIGLALERARHLDRIRLTGSGTSVLPMVDVLVPEGRVEKLDESATTVQFAGLTTTATPTDARPPGLVSLDGGLARFERSSDRISVVAAGFHEAAGSDDSDNGTYLDAIVSADLMTMQVGGSCAAELRFGTADGTEKLVGRSHLALYEGEFVCEARTEKDSATTLTGELTGKLVYRLGIFKEQKRLLTSRPTTIDIVRTDDSVTVTVTVEVTATDVTSFAVKTVPTSGWPTRMAVTVDDLTVETTFMADDAAVNADSASRQAATAALDLLGPDELTARGRKLLFEAAPPVPRTSTWVTDHDFVFFTRRHRLRDGGAPDAG